MTIRGYSAGTALRLNGDINGTFGWGRNLNSYRNRQWWQDDRGSGYFSGGQINMYHFFGKRPDNPVVAGSVVFYSSQWFTVPLHNNIYVYCYGGGGGGGWGGYAYQTWSNSQQAAGGGTTYFGNIMYATGGGGGYNANLWDTWPGNFNASNGGNGGGAGGNANNDSLGGGGGAGGNYDAGPGVGYAYNFRGGNGGNGGRAVSGWGAGNLGVGGGIYCTIGGGGGGDTPHGGPLNTYGTNGNSGGNGWIYIEWN
jgi:hypothetical protein